ncbi:MAG: TolC family protein [Rhizomicrobium sp.]
MRHHKVILSALLPFLLAGCATSALKLAPSRPDRPWKPDTNAAGEIQPGEPASESADGYVLPSNASLSPAPPAPVFKSDHRYTLAELIDIAEQSNPATRIAWDSARNAALSVGVAESTYLPRVTASVVAGYHVAHGHDSALGFSADGDNSASGTISAISAEWLLFDFRQAGSPRRSSTTSLHWRDIAFTAAHQQVIHSVSVAYLHMRRRKSRVDVADRSLKNAEAVEAAAQARYKHGVGTVIETAQTHQVTAQAHLAQVQADGGAENSRVALLSAMGISPLAVLKIATPNNQVLSPVALGSADKIVSDALARRPDMLAAYCGTKGQRREHSRC